MTKSIIEDAEKVKQCINDESLKHVIEHKIESLAHTSLYLLEVTKMSLFTLGYKINSNLLNTVVINCDTLKQLKVISDENKQ